MTFRVDGHQHFWSLERNDYGWLTPELAPLYRDFGPLDLRQFIEAVGVSKTVVVQAAQTEEETHYLLELAAQHDFIAGVVGWIDMAAEDASQKLTTLSRHPKFVGIRPMIENIYDPAWMLRPALDKAFQSLIENNLCFDALVKSIHLPNLLELLKRYPDLACVIDHGAKPDIASGSWQPWAEQIQAIATETTAYCKLSGLITEASSKQSYDDLAPYMDHLLLRFGAERLIWGSDWPVLNLAGDYTGWHTASQKWLANLRLNERQLVEGDNAIQFYSLQI